MASDSRGGWVMIRQNATEQELEQLESCLVNLYENLDCKIRATGVILVLSQKLECLAALAMHSSALCALSRILREDGQKSFTLRMNIISVFFIFSFFRNFHQVLVGQNIGRSTLQTLALELKFSELQPIPDPSFSIVQQERLLYMSFTLLLNLAYNLHIEEKMRKFALVELLCNALESSNTDLLHIVIVFLTKLSVFKENKETMKRNGIVLKLSCLLCHANELLVYPVLRLLRNLAFDPVIRSEMVKYHMIQAVGPLLKQHQFEHAACTFLYCLSLDRSIRSAFVETEVMGNLVQIILCEPLRDVSKELMALIVNLTAVRPIAEVLCKPFVVEKLLKRATKFCSPMLFKVIRNVSLLEDSKSFLLCFVPDLVTFFVEGEQSVQVEVIGALNNMIWFEETTDVLVQKELLLSFAERISSTNDEMLNEICTFLGAVSSNQTAPMISEAGLAVKLCSAFLERAKGERLINQFIYMMSRFLLFEPTRQDILSVSDKISGYILKLTKDSNSSVARYADTLFNILMEVDHNNYVNLKSPMLRTSSIRSESRYTVSNG